MNRAETLAQHKRRMSGQFAQGPRYCTNCKQTKPRAGGREIAINGGRNARWVCADCGARHA